MTNKEMEDRLEKIVKNSKKTGKIIALPETIEISRMSSFTEFINHGCSRVRYLIDQYKNIWKEFYDWQIEVGVISEKDISRRKKIKQWKKIRKRLSFYNSRTDSPDGWEHQLKKIRDSLMDEFIEHVINEIIHSKETAEYYTEREKENDRQRD